MCFTETMQLVSPSDPCRGVHAFRKKEAVRWRGTGLSRSWVVANTDSMRLAGGASQHDMKIQLRPFLLLNLVVFLWSSDECLIKHMLDSGTARSPAFLNALRFSVAALALLPWLPGVPWRDDLHEIWQAGAELGLFMFFGFAAQTIGLQYTSASRSAFLLYMNVVLVPLLGRLIFQRSIRGRTWLKVGMVVVGTVLLSYDGATPNVGDIWCLSAAVSSAVFILRLEDAAQRFDAAKLQCASMWTVASLSLLWLIITEGCTALQPTRSEFGSALYLGVVTTALCSFLQVPCSHPSVLSVCPASCMRKHWSKLHM